MDVSKLSDISGLRLAHQLERPDRKPAPDFAAAMQEKAEADRLQFSKHATQRMETRGVEMTPVLMDKLSQAVAKAREKGAKDVVVIGKTGAFIVNVPNNTVITTMTELEMRENIFTNIDSAVLI